MGDKDVIYTKLKHVQSWLWLALLDPDKPICRDEAAKGLEDINLTLNTIEKG